MNWSSIINNKIKVGFLASGFAKRNSSGTAKQFEAITKLLCTKFQSQVEVVLFCNDSDQYTFLSKNPAFLEAKFIFFPSVKGKWLRSSRQYFKYAFSQNPIKVDILHFSVPRFYPFFWLFPARKFVCTFHAGGDITASQDKFIVSREIYNMIAKIFYRKLNSIIAVSEYGKKEISQAYGIPNNLISVMYPGTDDIWNIVPTTTKTFGKNGKILVLVIGRWQRYKNVQVVSNALAKANPVELDKYYFVFVGKQISSNVELIKSDLLSLNEYSYKTIDYLDDQDYVSIISEAELVIVPSLNEGFSLPVFDAFSFGTRVMLHNPSPAAQILIGQKGVIATNLNSSDNLLAKISNALEQEKGRALDNREFLKSIGATWEGLTRNYLAIYESLINPSIPKES